MTQRPRLLCAEDDEDIRSIIQMALEDDFDVKLVASGEAALQCAEAFAPALLLLDVMMPDMDGVETLQRLRQMSSLAKVPAIFVTAKVQSAEQRELIEAGACGIISKPFDPMTLADRILGMCGAG